MNKIVGTQTHTHTHKPATNITGPHKAPFSPYRRRTSDVCPSCPHIPGMPGASSESFLLDHPTFYLERQQDHQGCSRSVYTGPPPRHPMCSWNSHGTLSFITEIMCFLLFLLLSAWNAEWVPWVKESCLPHCCIPHTCCFASISPH